MSLIQCPECQKDISDQAAFCPNCGWPPAGRAGKIGESKILGGALMAVAAGGMALGLAVALFAKNDGHGNTPPVLEAQLADMEIQAPSRPDDLKKIAKLADMVARLEAKVAELEARPPAALPPTAAEEVTLDSLIAANEAILATLGEAAAEEADAAAREKGQKRKGGKGQNDQAPKPAAFEATVIQVVDGDTLLARTASREDVEIRLYGLGAPAGRRPAGTSAAAALKSLKGRTVTVRALDTDHYNRKVALVEHDGRLVNVDLAAQGRASYSGQYCRRQPVCGRIKAAEAEARAAKRGLWASDDPTPPWLRPGRGE